MDTPRVEIFRSLPEIKTIASIARELGVDILLHGSVAAALLNAAYGQSLSTAHLFDLVPPLSDIDLLVHSPSLALQVRAEIRRQLPAGGFFHWEVRSPEQLRTYRRWAHIKLSGQPGVLFVHPESHANAKGSAGRRVVISLDSTDELDIDFTNDFLASDISIQWLDESLALNKSNIDGALRDILYLARIVPDKLGETEVFQDLRRSLQEVGGATVAQGLLRSPAELRRTLFALVKYLFARAALSFRGSPPQFDPLLGERFWLDLNLEITDPVFRELARRVMLPDEPFQVVVLPRRVSNRWQRRIVHLHALDPAGNAAKKEFLEKWSELLNVENTTLAEIEVQGQAAGMFLSPAASLRTAEPPDPGCCTYRDFSRGIAEIAWIEPVPPRKPIRALSALVFVPDFKDLFFAHSYLTAGKASSLRLDYGFLCILASGRRNVKVLGLGVHRES